MHIPFNWGILFLGTNCVATIIQMLKDVKGYLL